MAEGPEHYPSGKPIPGHHLQPVDSQQLHEATQDLDDVDGDDGSPPGHDVTIDEDLAITNCQQHLFGLAGLDIYWAKVAPLNPVLGLFFGLRGIVVVSDGKGLY